MSNTFHTVFVAGATGAIGSRLVSMLVERGHRVFGTTRAAGPREQLISQAGAIPVVADVFDRSALIRVLADINPDVVVHQLTDLPRGLDASRMEEGVHRNARIRREGTANLVAAAQASGARRIVAQSVAWLYRAGDGPFTEDMPLDLDAQGLRAVSVAGVLALEQAVLGAAPVEGLVLRYGQLWGPHTGNDSFDGKTMPVHVDSAAMAATLAVEAGQPGIYNVADGGDVLDTRKARRELGWMPRGLSASRVQS
ncbi:NAD(P)-dependent oxidoreductase [Dyella sp.]|uniref:NAD-dependent epimerase/dehydratase family protein n=1 Tax=Dyella sp. TaxID=1869338 RepID=UPI002ED533F5